MRTRASWVFSCGRANGEQLCLLSDTKSDSIFRGMRMRLVYLLRAI